MKQRPEIIRCICFIAALFFLGLSFLQPQAQATGAQDREIIGVVSKISDGDTVHVVTIEGSNLRVRIWGMDALT